jgi:hypothetical protein
MMFGGEIPQHTQGYISPADNLKNRRTAKQKLLVKRVCKQAKPDTLRHNALTAH